MSLLLRLSLTTLIVLLFVFPLRAQTPRPESLTAGLVAWLPLDETTGTQARDASGTGRAAVIVNGGTWHPAGRIGGCVRLTDGAALQIPLTWTPTAFTVSWWVKAEKIGNWTQAVGGNLNRTTVWQGFMFHATDIGKIYAGTAQGTELVTADHVFKTDTWQHFVFTFKDGQAALYKDGNRIAYRASGMTPSAAWQQLSFGSTRYGTLWAEGYYDDIRVYGRALSAAEVTLLTGTGRPLEVPKKEALETGLVAWLPLDEQDNAVTRAQDASGAGRHGQRLNVGPNQGNWHQWGKIGGCVRLNNGAALQIPLAWQPTSFTVSWWVYADGGMVKDYMQTVGNELNPANGDAWQGFLFHTSATGRIYTGTDWNSHLESGDKVFQTGVWQHFVFTFDQGKSTLYKDGNRIAYRSDGTKLPAAWQQLSFGSTK